MDSIARSWSLSGEQFCGFSRLEGAVMSKLVGIIRECMDEIAKEFNHCPPNFLAEADLQSELFSLLRSRPDLSIQTNKYRVKVHLVHAQWPRVVEVGSKKVGGYYDLVVWQSDSARHPEEYRWIPSKDRAAKMGLDIVVEIKHRRGNLKHPARWCKQDIDKLKDALNTKKARCAYYLVFIDNVEEADDNKKSFDDIKSYLRKQKRDDANLEMLLVSRNSSEWL